MSLKGLNLNALAKRAPLPAPKVIPTPSKEAERLIREETQTTDAIIAATDAIIDSTPGGAKVVEPTEANISGESDKLSRLVDDNFPFDETQLTAVYGMVQEQYACMIGAAGTGKTTVERKLVDLLRDGLDEIDMSQYWKRGAPADGDDDYETPERLIPNILMCSFTGRSTQMTKKNFPRDWHGNIMTIHRALGFYPEFYPDVDIESGQMVNKRRFVPAYTAENKMPWKIIIIDEAGMLGLDLWHQLWAACEPDTRIYMIGDIQQLKPTHGHSVLGFALNSWPTWELTHVHRQQGANNSIVDNAHRILQGRHPVSDIPDLSFKTPKQMIEALTKMTQDKTWRFLNITVDDNHQVASQRIRQGLKLLQGKLYEPNRDVVITPINGYEQTSPGYSLGQSPMNQALVTMLNSDSPRYLIDAGREKQNFAVGDKVMATVNDYEAGITNGMAGIITGIAPNGAFMGDSRRWGLISDVNEYMDSIDEDDDDDGEFNLDEMVSDSQVGMEELRKREKKDSGPASHVVTVRFGEGDHGFELPFNTKSSVASLMLAYVATCHKLQGGEAPLVFGIIHSTNKRMLEREWAYTMVTRAADRCVVFSNRQGWGFALGKQAIKGTTLKQKIATFSALTDKGILGPSVRVKLPQACSLVTDVIPYQPKEVMNAQKEQPQEPVDQSQKTLAEDSPQGPDQGADESVREVRGDTHIHIHIREAIFKRVQPDSVVDRDRGVRTVDGGELKATPAERQEVKSHPLHTIANYQLPAPAHLVSQIGAFHTWERLTRPAPLLLTHQPAPAPKNPLAALLAKQRSK